MTSATEYTDGLLHTYRRVPPTGPGICLVCHSGPNASYDRCHSCHETMRQVSRPTRHVVPISLYRKHTQLAHVLREYKYGSVPAVIGRFTMQIAAMLAQFMEGHERCLTSLGGGVFSVVTIVPSTRVDGTAQTHPLERAVKLVRRLKASYQPVLERGPASARHNQADDDAFSATDLLDGQRVLLIDDTFTSGARVQSAASTLYRAGAADVTPLVVGRIIDPGWNLNCRRIWDASGTEEFSFATCCLCAR